MSANRLYFGDCLEVIGMRNAAVNTGLFMDAQVVQIYTADDYFEGRRPALPVAA